MASDHTSGRRAAERASDKDRQRGKDDEHRRGEGRTDKDSKHTDRERDRERSRRDHESASSSKRSREAENGRDDERKRHRHEAERAHERSRDVSRSDKPSRRGDDRKESHRREAPSTSDLRRTDDARRAGRQGEAAAANSDMPRHRRDADTGAIDRSQDRARERERPRPSDRSESRSAVDADRQGGKSREHRQGDREKGGRSADMEEGEEEDDGGGNAANGQAHAPEKAAPMSLEEVLKKRKEAEEAAAKPVFLTKQQRQALALERRKQQSQAMRTQAEAARSEARAAHGAASAQASAAPPGTQRRREEQSAAYASEKEKAAQAELIRKYYLGSQHQKRKLTKASDKFKFKFEWDAKEDTYEAPLHDGAILFGRGVRGGVDHRAQREAAAQHEQSYLSKMRTARGEMTSAADVAADLQRAQRAALTDYDPVAKEKKWQEKGREEMTSRDWRIFREDHRMSFSNSGANAPLPFRSWDEMPLPTALRQAISDLGYLQPTAIQMAAIPYGLRQRDVIGLAETGSGKTAAFVLPMLMYIMEQPEMTEQVAAEGPYALVLAPTRELAQQIDEETTKLARHTPYRSCCIVGGTSYEDQIGRLRRGAEIVVATPGRLLDCIRRSYAVLNQCNYVVLDEADRMIEYGFEQQVIDVLSAMPSSNLKPVDEEEFLEAEKTYRTTYMFSATMPPAVRRIANRYLRRPVTVTVGAEGKATDNVSQRVEWTDKKNKPAQLLRTIDRFQEAQTHLSAKDDGFKVIVFANGRDNCEDVHNALVRTGNYSVALIHGGKSQEQREESIKGFRTGEYDVMVATDVAGRGIDIKDVGMVINYDMPNNIQAYTHRIGRTGRAGRKGTAVTFLTPQDDKVFYDLKQFLEDSKAAIPPQLANSEAARVKPGSMEQSRKDTTMYAA